jgi:zinc transport system ATP-binding protein
VSGGQFQQFLVAFALVGNPNVLLLDEPTAGLDEPGQERLH